MSTPRRGRQTDRNTIQEIELVEYYLHHKCINLEYRLNTRQKSEMMVDLEMTKHRLVYLLKLMRKKEGITKLKKIIRRPRCDVIQKHLIEKGFIRGSQREGAACELIIELLMNLYSGIKILRQGVGLYIGTQTPQCASKNPKNGKNIDDNLEVFWALKWSTTSPVVMIQGDAVNIEKAHDKINEWRSRSSVPSNTKITPGMVDKNTFVKHIRKLAKTSGPKRMIKVVLLTSGSWINPNNNGIDCNYESVAVPLTIEHDNLHIFAMTRAKGVSAFDVRYIHRGIEIIWRAGKQISNIDRRTEFPKQIIVY